MANYRKHKAKRNRTSCAICKPYKHVGNSKLRWGKTERVKRLDAQEEIGKNIKEAIIGE